MIKTTRYHKLNTEVYRGGPVLYWMNRDMRVEHNWALLRAQEIALENNVPLMVVYNLDPEFLGGTERQLHFKQALLKEIETQCLKKNILFNVLVGAHTEMQLVSFITQHKVGYMVTDFSPLHIQRQWLEYVVSHVEIPCERVDAHNIVPVWVASQKQEVGARTLRPKLHRLLPEYLEKFPSLQNHPFGITTATVDWQSVDRVSGGKKAVPIPWIAPSRNAALRALSDFLERMLPQYADDRNNPNAHAQSNLSPYFHYGVLAPQEVVLAVCEKVGVSIEALLHQKKNAAKVALSKKASLRESAEAFLEELVVRRELSDNFCFYNPHYDSVLGFAPWAQETLRKHASDKREYLYTQEQFEQAQTHDDLWNAAQREMVQTGKMHGYMRMYWAKKILEWTPSAKEALHIAIALNDTYELDGRDPNGYAGIAWSIGGVHDRPWFDRPVFGLVRYMARSGCEKKFDTKEYIARWGDRVF